MKHTLLGAAVALAAVIGGSSASATPTACIYTGSPDLMATNVRVIGNFSPVDTVIDKFALKPTPPSEQLAGKPKGGGSSSIG